MIDTNPQSQLDSIAHLPGDILLSLARNESVTKEMRKAAVRLMLQNGFPQYKHPELLSFVLELELENAAHDEVEAIVETAIESQIPSATSASFTTKDMQQPETIRNPEKLSEDALGD